MFIQVPVNNKEVNKVAIEALNNISFAGAKTPKAPKNAPKSAQKGEHQKGTHKSAQKGRAKERNILHDTPLRYVGYCDDIGATTRVICNSSKNAFIRNLPVISYIPVGLYIGADVVSTYNKAKDKGEKDAGKKAASTAIFQAITSLLFPILIVGAAQKVAGKGFDKFIPSLKQGFDGAGNKIVNHKRDVALALTGLGALIGLSKPADNFAQNVLMDKIVNPALGLDKHHKHHKAHKAHKEA